MERAELIAQLRGEFGPAIEAVYAELGLSLPHQVLLYGSWAWGRPHADSDLDLAVIAKNAANFDQQATISLAIKKILRRDFANAVEVHFANLEELVRSSKFAQCIHSKIMTGGVTIWSAPEEVRAANLAAVADAELSAADAKKDWVRGFELKAFAVMVAGRKFNSRFPWEYAQNAYTGACFSLWALLYDANIDPSPTEFRWRLGRLLEIATWIDGNLKKLEPLLEVLPERFCRENISDEISDTTEEESRKALAAAWRIYRAAKRSIRARREEVSYG